VAVVGCTTQAAPTPAPSVVYRVTLDGADVPRAEVEALAVELTARASNLEVEGLRFAIVDPDRLAVYVRDQAGADGLASLTRGPRVVRALGDRAPAPGAPELWNGGDVPPGSVRHLRDEMGVSRVELVLTPVAAHRFAKWTTEHVGDFTVIVVDGVAGDPIQVLAPILGGQLALSFAGQDPESARALAVALTFGAAGYQLVPVAPDP
jgi:hypothetical protein